MAHAHPEPSGLRLWETERRSELRPPAQAPPPWVAPDPSSGLLYSS